MAGIVFGCIVPHPPLLVPEIGEGREAEISATTQAMKELASQMARKKPQAVLVISPHGPSLYDAMGIATARIIRGSLRQWGTRSADFDFKNDPGIVSAIQEEAGASGIPLASVGDEEYSLDHGAMVPLYFLINSIKGAPLVPLTFSWLPLQTHFSFGQAIKRALDKTGKRVAIIASGDLSHRLIPGAPAGYDPMGQAFDKKLTEAVSTYDVPSILNMDHRLIEKAGECGLRSIVILLGAMDGYRVTQRVLSYEGPFGVGYMVASFDIEQKRSEQTHPLVKLAKSTVEKYIREGKRQTITNLTPDMKEKAGVFVSIKKQGQLRGCIGTFEPTQPNIANEIVSNAISASTRDPRFPPVTPEELPELTYSVDILTRPVPVEKWEQLDPKKYGIIVESGNRRGLLLPALEGVDTVQRQIDICRQKAGIGPDDPIKIRRFEVKRYK